MTPQLYAAAKSFSNFIGRHHPVLFITAMALLLGVAIFTLYQISTLSLAEADETQPTLGAFDQKTVDKIKDLHISSDGNNSTLVFPTPRSNPFIE